MDDELKLKKAQEQLKREQRTMWMLVLGVIAGTTLLALLGLFGR